MELLKLHLHDFCQFRDTQLNFTPGLNLVVGPNGSGKSNALKAAFGSITGDFRSRNEGVTVDNISQLAKDKSCARVQSWLKHGGAQMFVSRILHRDGKVVSRLEVSNVGYVATYAKTTEVNSAILKLLGVSPRMLSDYVFVDQWAIFSFLTATPGDRAKAFQRLFGTDKAETIYKAAGEQLNKLVIPTTGITLDSAHAELDACKKHVNEILTGLEGFVDVSDTYSAETDPDNKLLQDAHRRRQLIAEVDEHIHKIQHIHEDICVHKTDTDDLRVNLVTMRGYVRESKGAMDAARYQLVNWQRWRDVERSRQFYDPLITAYNQELHRLGGRPKATDAVLPQERLTDLQLRIAERQEAYEHERRRMMCMNNGVCPTCWQSTTGMGDPIAQAHLVDRISNELTDLQTSLAVSETYYNNLAGWELNYQTVADRLTVAEGALANLPYVEKPDRDEEELKAYLARMDEMATEAEAAAERLSTLQAAVARGEAELEVHKNELARKQAELLGLPEINEDEARKRLAERCKRYLAKRELRTALQHAQEAVQHAEKRLRDLEAIEAEGTRLKAWQDRLVAIRNVYHRDSAPRIAAQNYLEVIQEEVNDTLEQFDCDYRVQADEGLSFVATFVKGPKAGAVQPAGRLSGGEKVLLGIAFRVSVNALFAKDIGLLVLDEPTAGLDRDNLKCLEVAFQRLRELSFSRGLQIIMITHEENLPAADNLIEIGG
jgi:DNA repair exonuclease SbcCD ATPase subunit